MLFYFQVTSPMFLLIMGILCALLIVPIDFIDGTGTRSYYGTLNKEASQEGLNFSAWGGESNKIFIRNIEKGDADYFRIQGTADGSSGGVISQKLNYTSQNLTLKIGDVLIFSNENPFEPNPNGQISFVFHVNRNAERQADLKFVMGQLFSGEGWQGNNYYMKVNPRSAYNIMLPENSTLEGITVGIQQNSTVNPVDFAILLDRG